MHIRLSPEFLGLSEIDVRAHEALLDRMLHIHLNKIHLMCLTPREVLKLRRSIQFGPQAIRVLDTITRRAQDYAASLRSASMHLIVLPSGKISAPDPIGREFYVRSEDIHWWLEHAPHVCVENAISDGSIYSFIIKQAVSLIGGAPDNVAVRPFHGGGSPLGAMMEMQFGNQIQGLCICDRDKTLSVPPFTQGSTSDLAHQALHRLRVVDAGGRSELRNPFFSFKITEGWGVENYIGPYMLDWFFELNHSARAMRSDILSAFPNFPILSEQEIEEWWLVNFKVQNQDSGLICQALVERYSRQQADPNRCQLLSSLAMPDSIIPFVATFSKAGRYHRSLIEAFRRDLRSEVYRLAIEELGRKAINALAADDRMNFA